MDLTSNSIQSMNEIIALCDLGIQKRTEEAKTLIKDYYDWWSLSNREVLNLRSLGENVNTGVIAPFIRIHRLNDKVYISWVLWPRKSLEQRAKSSGTFAKQIKARKRGYAFEQLAVHCQAWELAKVEETEKQLSVLRDTLNLLHQTKVNLNRYKKKLIKSKESCE
jgi:hypothetical protein